MKDQILALRQTGKSYKEICQILNCSKGTVAYHCGDGQKKKSQKRQQNRRKDLVILNKVENFQCDKRRFKDKTVNFQRERVTGGKGKMYRTFNWEDVINKFSWETSCYLTGRKINLREPLSYEFDHIEPISKGGEKTINNLGICCRDANRTKNDLSVNELLKLCQEILTYNGYEVKELKVN